jgi:tol-pal system protein YbgF
VLALAGAMSLAQAQQSSSGPPGKMSPPAGKEMPQGADAGLQRRLEQLEEQFVDLQVMVGTLESLARGTSPPPQRTPVASVASSADMGRLDAIETQIKALAAQLEHLQEQVRSLVERAPAKQPSFGDVTVAPAPPKDEIDRVFGTPKAPALPKTDPPPQVEPPPRAVAPTPPARVADDGPPPQRLYEQAYGFMLQKDFGAAEQTFEEFLKRHPNHHLAGNAQYWLGETFFVRNQFKPAAAAFLKGYKDYAKSQKAPESLLKLAMSLQRLGQKDAACSSFRELQAKFPAPPAHVRSLAKTERKRSGC